jgi:hypothetical protein
LHVFPPDTRKNAFTLRGNAAGRFTSEPGSCFLPDDPQIFKIPGSVTLFENSAGGEVNFRKGE